MTAQSSPSRRVHLVDEFRGLVILLMVFYHAAYDLVYIFNVNFPLFHSPLMHYLQVFISGTFIIVSGISCRFSRNNLKRGLIALGLGIGFTLVTWLFMPDQIIKFGVLHLLGSCMILYALLEKLLNKLQPIVGAVICVLLQLFTLHLPHGYLGLSAFPIKLPVSLYQTGFLFWLGLPAKTFYSSDYFPLIPWSFLFLAGSFAGVYLKNNTAPDFFYRQHIPFLSKVGKHTLWIYLLHQPITYGLFMLIFYIIH